MQEYPIAIPTEITPQNAIVTREMAVYISCTNTSTSASAASEEHIRSNQTLTPCLK